MTLCHTFPSCWKDLNQYKLLIIQTARCFSDKSWLHQDIAFRNEVAAGSGSTDWSRMHPDLYNFHTRSLATTSAALGSSTCSALSLTEPQASSGNHQSCQYSHSWNDGCPLAPAGFFTPAKQALETTLTSTALTIQHGANGVAPLLCQRGVTAITRSPLLANSAVHSFDSVLFGSHDNFSAPSVLPSQQQGLPSSGHLLHSLAVCPLRPVPQLTPITEDRFQHELRLHPNPDKVVYVGQGLGDDFHLGSYCSASLKPTGGLCLWHS